MSITRLPPVGNPILLRKESAELLPKFEGCAIFWLDSGTSSLAVAMAAARALRPEIEKPEVVIPSYGCPDLVAAAMFANITPVIADIQPTDPGYDLSSLEGALSANTVAVVAVNFLGIKERLLEIQKLLNRSGGAKLIEDNAQWFPEPFRAETMMGDFMCLSFGRGKPLSLLGGGACIVRNDVAEVLKGQLQVPSQSPPSRFVGAKILAYNALLNRNAYGILSRLPFLGLGDTALHTLEGVEAIDSVRKKLLPPNLYAYQQRSRSVEQHIHRIVSQFSQLIDLPAIAGARCGRLLRYPVLFESREQCARAYTALELNGLGASLMYRRPLLDIPRVADKCKPTSGISNASEFAGRLLTLPTHQSVQSSDIERMSVVLRQVLEM